MKLLKILTEDLKAPTQWNFQYEIGKTYTCLDFDESDKKCSRGFYATELEGLPYTFRHRKGHRVFDYEVSGKSREFDQYQRRYEICTVLPREYSYAELRAMAEAEEERLGYRLSHVLFPVNPLELEAPPVTDEVVALLKEWDTVRGYVFDSVWGSVIDSVRDTAWGSVIDSVRDSAWGSVEDSVTASFMDNFMDYVGGSVTATALELVRALVSDTVRKYVWGSVEDSAKAYIGWMFLNITKWHNIDHEEGVYPFESGVKLWLMGFVPTFEGKGWNLHAGPKADIVYSITREELEEMK